MLIVCALPIVPHDKNAWMSVNIPNDIFIYSMATRIELLCNTVVHILRLTEHNACPHSEASLEMWMCVGEHAQVFPLEQLLCICCPLVSLEPLENVCFSVKDKKSNISEVLSVNIYSAKGRLAVCLEDQQGVLCQGWLGKVRLG